MKKHFSGPQIVAKLRQADVSQVLYLLPNWLFCTLYQSILIFVLRCFFWRKISYVIDVDVSW